MARFSFENTTIAYSFCAMNSDTFCGAVACFWYDEKKQRLIICVLDGLGHGKYAAEAAIQIKKNIEILHYYYDDLVLLLRDVHEATYHTRGASCGLIEIDFISQTLKYVGVGNIRAFLIDAATQKSRHFPSVYGVLGSGRFPQKLTVTTIQLTGQQQMLLVYTDGLPELLRFPPVNTLLSFDELDQLTQHWLETHMLNTDDALILACQLENK